MNEGMRTVDVRLRFFSVSFGYTVSECCGARIVGEMGHPSEPPARQPR